MRFAVKLAEIRTRIVEGTDIQAVEKHVRAAQKKNVGGVSEFLVLSIEPISDEETQTETTVPQPPEVA